jgi:hypothetical protein
MSINGSGFGLILSREIDRLVEYYYLSFLLNRCILLLSRGWRGRAVILTVMWSCLFLTLVVCLALSSFLVLARYQPPRKLFYRKLLAKSARRAAQEGAPPRFSNGVFLHPGKHNRHNFICWSNLLSPKPNEQWLGVDIL